MQPTRGCRRARAGALAAGRSSRPPTVRPGRIVEARRRIPRFRAICEGGSG
jgi:hypothetical protein